MTINGKRVFFQRAGCWIRASIRTASTPPPRDAALKKDIERLDGVWASTARACTRRCSSRGSCIGPISWATSSGASMANWGLDIARYRRGELRSCPSGCEVLARDFSHPSHHRLVPAQRDAGIMNGHRQCDDVLRMTYRVTKADRPDASGASIPVRQLSCRHRHSSTCTTTSRIPTNSRTMLQPLAEDSSSIYVEPLSPDRQKYDSGRPVFVSEYGGISLGRDEQPAAGATARVRQTEEEFLERYQGPDRRAAGQPERICAFCYTQLYDVEQEQNGLYDLRPQAEIRPRDHSRNQRAQSRDGRRITE